MTDPSRPPLSPAPAPAGEVCKEEIDCETCGGSGTIDETLGGYGDSNPAATCPDCDGIGVITVPTPAPAGEAGELVAWLTEQAVRAADCKQPMAAGMLTWVAQVVGEHTELLGRCHAAPVPAEEEEPCLQWTENRPPGTDDCPYDHCIAETPFGRFLITWKSWKEHGSPTVDETPWGDWWQAFSNVDKAKDACKREYVKRLLTCRVDNSAAPLERHPAPVPVSERLPELGDCDGEHYCWRWNTIGGLWARQPLARSWYEFESHWLPATALPLPSGEVYE